MEKTKRLEEALRVAYLSRRSPQPSHQWEARVMREVRALATEKKGESWGWLDSLFWKLTPALATLILVLGAAALKIQLLPHDLAGGIVQDPLVLTVISMFGV